MPVSRMRMRPWLEKMIESNKITGLTWLDNDKTMFSIPWKHAARHGWELNKDACLFKEWAIHTGKYSEGKATDPKTWKANFRCAMNSLPDIEEVKDKSINKGHHAVRVFRMLPYSPKCREKRSKAKESRQKKKSCVVKMEEESDDSDSQSPRNEQDDSTSTQENTVDSTVLTDGIDFPLMASSDVPECSHSVEIGPESFCHRFEVSPEHSTDYSDFEEIIEICRQLENVEKEPHCVPFTSLDSMNLGNLTCTSPGSQWSESSSDESDEMPHYTTLGPEFILPTDDSWKSFPFSLNSLL